MNNQKTMKLQKKVPSTYKGQVGDKVGGNMGNRLGDKESSISIKPKQAAGWFKDNGSLKSKEAIQRICGDSPEKWGKFLEDTVDSKISENEYLLGEAKYIEECFSPQDQDSPSYEHIIQEENFQKLKYLKILVKRYLSPREAQVIGMYFFMGLSQREIANSIGISRRTVRVLLDRGLKKIKMHSKKSNKIINIEAYFSELKEQAKDSIWHAQYKNLLQNQHHQHFDFNI